MELKERSYEETDRDGRWVRNFALRTDPWIMVEHWASEQGYRMVAMKGSSRRLYVKNQDSKWLRKFVDIRSMDSNARIQIVSWMEAGWQSRLASLYRLPELVNLFDEGYFGMRARRELTQELNTLLMRFRQSMITGSLGFHLMDLSPETLLFGFGLILISLLFPALFLSQMPLSKVWLGYSLTQTLQQFAWVAIPAIVMALLLVLVYRFSTVRWVRATAAGFLFAAVLGIGGYHFHQSLGKHLMKVAFANCFEDMGHASCQAWLNSMPPEKRVEVIRQFDRLRQIVIKK